MSLLAISFDDVQAIQASVDPHLGLYAPAGEGPVRGSTACAIPPEVRKRLVPVDLWGGGCCVGPSAISVPGTYKPSCEGDMPLVAPDPDKCPEVSSVDPSRVEEVARGVAEGLRVAPQVTVRPAPWVAPDYRGVRDPQTVAAVLSTFGTTDVRTLWARNALRSYLGSNFPVSLVALTAGQTAEVLTFQPTDAFSGDSFEVISPDQEVLYLVQWAVAVNGKYKAGPFFLTDGRAPVNVQARRGDTVSVVAISELTDSFSVGLLVRLDGWTHPSLTQTDGTYTKVLRSSPSWPGGGRTA